MQVAIVPVNLADSRSSETAQLLHDELEALGIEVLLDDRDERPGVKFKDADLIGLPLRVTLGKTLATGEVELTARRTRQMRKVRTEELVSQVRRLVSEGESAFPELFAP